MVNEPVKLVFSGKIARQLLRLNYQIVDLRPNRENTDRTVFVFKDVPGLKENLRKLSMESMN